MLDRTPQRLVAVVVVALVAASCGGSSSSGVRLPDQTAEQEALLLHSGVLRPPNAEPRIVLTNTSGARYDVRQQGAGKVTLVYFGYTHCPDVCPTTMADIAQGLRAVAPSIRRKVTVVFVSVDPHRDTPAKLRTWLDSFNTGFIGLRGSLRQVIAAQRSAHLPVSKVSKNGKEVEHAAQVVVYTPDRLEHTVFFDGPSTIDDLVHDLPILATGKGFGA